jgi:anti-sigma factor RsiW
MNCREVRARAPLYLSGEMEAPEREPFAAHLGACAACEREIDAQMRLDSRLAGALGEYPDSRALEKRVWSGIARQRYRGRALTAAAAAAVILAGIVGMRFLQSAPAPAAFADAALDHHEEVVEKQPRRWRTASGEIGALAAADGLSYAALTSLAARGYTLVRAKHCGIDGQAMLHLVFGNGAREYSVFLRPERGERSPVRIARESQEQVAGFQTGKFRAIVVIDGPRAECEALAQIAAARL